MSKKFVCVAMTALVLSLAGHAFAQIGPAGWYAQRVGDGVDGSVSISGTTYTITGDGHDIWDASDGFQYMYKTLTGDGSMTARVVSVGTGSNNWAKGGVMIRQDNTGPSADAYQVITGSDGNGAGWQWRPSAGAGATWDGAGPATAVAPPYWVRIERTGNVFKGYISANGTTWTQLGTTQTITMTDPVLIGLCVTSHAAGELRTMTFDNVSFTGKVTDRPPQLKAWTPDPANGKIGVNMPLCQWKAGETAIFHNVYFGTTADLKDADLKATRQPFAMYFHVPGLQAGMTYYWRVDEIDAAGTVTKGDVWSFMSEPTKDYAPTPADGGAGLLPGVFLTWLPGKEALQHQVYFDSDMAAVTSGAASADKGKVSEAKFNTGALRASTTYYWRVDAIKLDKSVVKGDVWSFSTAIAGPANKIAYETWTNLAGTAVSALTSSPDYPSKPTTSTFVDSFQSPVDWADNYGQRLWGWLKPEQTGDYTFWIAGDDEQQLWLSTDASPTNAVRIANVAGWTPALDFDNTGGGAGSATAQKSALIKLQAGQKYFIMALGKEGGGGDSTAVAWQGPGIAARQVIPAKYVDMFALPPLQAFSPTPANGAVDAPQTGALSWSAGEKAQKHEVYFGEDQAAVAAADSKSPLFKGSQAGTTFSAGDLAWGKTYYWRVDETNAGQAGSPWKGNVWSFTTANFLPVDNMESYTDQAGSEIWTAWADGFADNFKSSGSTVGIDPAVNGTFGETRIVHGGKQSLPLYFNNTKTPFFSEAVQTFAPLQDWTGNGVTDLSLWVRGNPVKFVDKGNGAFTVSGSGHDIWDNADDFRFVFKQLNGNGSVTVKVESLVNTNGWAKAGVMIRESLNAGSTMAYMIQSFSNGASFGWRQTTDGAPGSQTQTGITAPQWVKLTRTGNAFTAQYSADGKTWTDIKNATGQVVSTTILMGTNVYIGLCTTSHDATRTTTAEYTGAATTGTVTGQWQEVWIGDDPDRASSAASLYVVVEDSTAKTATATNATAVTTAAWTEWKVPLSSLTGVNLAKVKKLTIGVGDKKTPAADGSGLIYIDDIRVSKP